MQSTWMANHSSIDMTTRQPITHPCIHSTLHFPRHMSEKSFTKNDASMDNQTETNGMHGLNCIGYGYLKDPKLAAACKKEARGSLEHLPCSNTCSFTCKPQVESNA